MVFDYVTSYKGNPFGSCFIFIHYSTLEYDCTCIGEKKSPLKLPIAASFILSHEATRTARPGHNDCAVELRCKHTSKYACKTHAQLALLPCAACSILILIGTRLLLVLFMPSVYALCLCPPPHTAQGDLPYQVCYLVSCFGRWRTILFSFFCRRDALLMCP